MDVGRFFRWPFWRYGSAPRDYSDGIAQTTWWTLQGAKRDADPAIASGIAAAAALYADAFAGARVDAGSPVVADALDAATLASAGRAVATAGEWTALVDTRDPLRLQLTPVRIVDTRGDARSPSYRVCIPGGAQDVELGPIARDALVHVVFRPSEGGGDRGVPGWAVAAAQAGANLERSVAREAGGGVGWTYPTMRESPRQSDGQRDERDQLADELTNSDGATHALPTQSDSWGRSGAEAGVSQGRDVRLERFGPEFATAYPELVKQLRIAAALAVGVPPPLLSGDSTSNAYREAHRAFLQTSVAGAARILEAELARATGAAVSLAFGAPIPADLASRGRTVKSLTESGVDLERAIVMAGLE